MVVPEGVIVGVKILALHGAAAGDNVSVLFDVIVIRSISKFVLLGKIDSR